MTTQPDASDNHALYLTAPDGPFEVGPAPVPEPGEHQLLVRQRATSVNPMDALPGELYARILPWITFPAIIGSDIAGDVVAVGAGVTRFAVGDHVLGLGGSAFQEQVTLEQHMAARVPDGIDAAHAAALPLTLATAATGLFQPDQLALSLPVKDAADQGAVVVIWGGSTSVGMNAIQLARNAGYRVVATASTRTVDALRDLGVDGLADRRSHTAVDDVLTLVGDRPVAGVVSIGDGSVQPCLEIAARAAGAHAVSSANPPEVARSGDLAEQLGVRLTSIWGGAIAQTHVGPAIFHDFLPGALADGRYRVLPEPTIVGHGLDRIPEAIDRLRGGVSAAKLVVTL